VGCAIAGVCLFADNAHTPTPALERDLAGPSSASAKSNREESWQGIEARLGKRKSARIF